MAVVIKKVPERSWRLFKAESARHGKRLGDFFARLVEEHLRHEGAAEKSWETILKRKSFLSDKDAEEMMKTVKEFRRGFRMRS